MVLIKNQLQCAYLNRISNCIENAKGNTIQNVKHDITDL